MRNAGRFKAASRRRSSIIRIEPLESICTLERRVLLSSAIPVGPQIPIDSQLFGPSIAMSRDGDFIVVAGGEDVHAQRFNVTGAPQGSAFLVNTYTTAAQTAPAVATDASGGFVIAWTCASQDGDLEGVFAQRFSSTGVPQGKEFRVNMFTTGQQANPSVAMSGGGEFVIAWASTGQDESSWGIYAQRYNSAGVAQGSEFRVNMLTTGEQSAASAAIDANGDFVIAWNSDGQDGSSWGVYARRYDAAGIPQQDEFLVNTTTSGSQVAPSAAMSAGGDFVIAWTNTFLTSGDNQVYAQRYDASGVAQGQEFAVSDESNGGPAHVSMDAGGDFVVAWGPVVSFPTFRGDLGPTAFFRRFDSAGTPLGGQQSIPLAPRQLDTLPTVAIDADGDYVVTWNRYEWFDPPGGGWTFQGVFAQRYAVIPQVSASELIFETAPHQLRFRFNHDVGASLSTDDIVVQNFTTGQPIPSSQFLLQYDFDTNLATFSYAGTPDGILPNGVYAATLLAGGISTPAGAQLAGDHTLNFFFMLADANRDARVNLSDYNLLAANFGQSPRTFTEGDFNYDSRVNLADYNILAGRFGAVLAPAGLAGGFRMRSFASGRSISDDFDDELSLLN